MNINKSAYSRFRPIQTYVIALIIVAICVGTALCASYYWNELPFYYMFGFSLGIMAIILIIIKQHLGFYLLLFSMFLPLRIPLGSDTVSCVWPIIIFLFCLYLAKCFVKGFSAFPLKMLTPFFVFTLFGFVSLTTSVDVTYSVKKLIMWLLAVAVLIIIVDPTSKSQREIVKYINCLFYASIVCGITGILLIIMGMIFGVERVVMFTFSEVYPLIRPEEDRIFHQVMMATRHPLLNWAVMDGRILRNISLFLSPIVTGSFFGLVAPMALSFYLNMKRTRWHLFIFLFAILNIALTQARGAWLGICLSLGFLIYFKNQDITKKIKVVSMLTVIGLVFIYFSAGIVLNRLRIDSSILTRFAYLQEGINIAGEHSFTGVGFANYEKYLNTIIREYPHNQFIELWAETGLGGMIAYIFILLSLLRRNYKRMHNASTAFDRAIYTGVVGSIIFFISHSFFEDLQTVPVIILSFFLLVGIAEANSTISDSIQLRSEKITR